ncbi:MAG: Gfo/Idh/MocA family oxidoreductase [Ruminococcaceae bacterium]|nr:Gfo/Idh/MocA family oxidoreductase [Oscillospiraceae bacterium]
MKKLTAVCLGYGMRGQIYSRYAMENPDQLEIVAVAEPVESKRAFAKERHNLPDDKLFKCWSEVAALPKMADFAMICTQDQMHLEPALACIEKGYNLLLEKPMAPTARECKIITEAAEEKGVKVIVCHVLRFTQFFYAIKNFIDDGEIGDIVSINHMENVGNLHQSHSFVRGNWHNEKESAPMILAKCCHDADILQWLVGKECKKVQSFGSLTHFNKDNRPDGAPTYCLDGCPHSETCFYDPIRFYVDNPDNGWRDVVADKINPTDDEVLEALKRGPYGKCVYACDNDVVDHQVVNLEFEDGCTVSLTMNAFNKGGRYTRIFGTKGEIYADMEEGTIDIYSFATKEHKFFELYKIGGTIFEGHGGGDTGIMVDIVKYFNDKAPSKSICSLRTSYLNHLICFAAEESRHNNTVIDLEKFSEKL